MKAKSTIDLELSWRNRLAFLRLAFALSKRGTIHLDSHEVEIIESENNQQKGAQWTSETRRQDSLRP